MRCPWGRGVKLGRPPELTPDKIAVVQELLAGDRSVAEVARMLGVSRAVLYDALQRRERRWREEPPRRRPVERARRPEAPQRAMLIAGEGPAAAR